MQFYSTCTHANMQMVRWYDNGMSAAREDKQPRAAHKSAKYGRVTARNFK